MNTVPSEADDTMPSLYELRNVEAGHLMRQRSPRFVAPASRLLQVALLASCSQTRTDVGAPRVSEELASSTFKAQPAPGVQSEGLDDGDAALRRGYGTVDMRFDSCVKAEGELGLKGEACSPGFVIYGPYVDVPDNSEVEVSFEIRPEKRVEVYADIVAEMGKQTLAGLSPQVIEAGVNQRLGYRVSVFKRDSNVESRIGLRSAEPVQFVVSNLTMTVR
jgi:hypothetical protein